jgi:hypothetical protein
VEGPKADLVARLVASTAAAGGPPASTASTQNTPPRPPKRARRPIPAAVLSSDEDEGGSTRRSRGACRQRMHGDPEDSADASGSDSGESESSDWMPPPDAKTDTPQRPPVGSFILVKCQFPDGPGLDIGRVQRVFDASDGIMARVKTLRSAIPATHKRWASGLFHAAGGETIDYWIDSIVLRFDKMAGKSAGKRIPTDVLRLLRGDAVWTELI